jgi:hypothetical protein
VAVGREFLVFNVKERGCVSGLRAQQTELSTLSLPLLTLIANNTFTVPMTLLCCVYTARARSIME